MGVALAVDWRFGWSSEMVRRISHPVIFFGRWISVADKRWNSGGQTQRICRGSMVTVALVLVSFFIGFATQLLIEGIVGEGMLSTLVVGLIAWPFVAARSLYTHVDDILSPLLRGDMEAARENVAKIVGRDPNKLSEVGIRKAAIESLAENSSDGVVAPIFWGACFGLGGVFAYKMINTLDSMIGYRNEKYEYFGKFAARLDDVANWVPARLTAVLLA
ncbi:UNVERIFIED_CONTAM: hypothetical protein GTU68_046717, partial [Idotea baltica]|nr:hypothetical protein [Idotea baltica]